MKEIFLRNTLYVVSFGAKDMLPNNFSLNGSVSLSEAQSGISSFRSVVVVFVSMCALTCVMFMVLSILKLGKAGDNEQERKGAIASILFSGIGLAIFGGMDILLALLWNMAGTELS